MMKFKTRENEKKKRTKLYEEKNTLMASKLILEEKKITKKTKQKEGKIYLINK